MLYHAFEMQKAWLAGASAFTTAGAQALSHPGNPFSHFGGGQMTASALEVFAHAAAPRGKPKFGLDTTVVDGQSVPVHEVVEARKPFGQLKHHPRGQRGRAQAADRRTDVGALCDAAARHRGTDAARP
jgi:poly(3-hydroxybutyrate) depolymerase